MIFKVGLYRSSKPEFLNAVKRNGVAVVSFYSSTASLPLVAAWTFLKEEYPEYTEEADKQIQLLKDFYGYEDIVE